MNNIAILQMLLCATLWSIAGIFIKAVPWNPLVIAGGRSLIAGLIALGYMRFQKIRFHINRDTWISGVLLSLTFLTFVTANKLTTSANAIVLQYSAPVFILLISGLFYHQRFRKIDYGVVGLTLIGITLCFLDQLAIGNMLGNGVAVLSGVCYAGMIVVTSHAKNDARMSGIVLGHLLTTLIGLPAAFLLSTPITMPALRNVVIMGVFQLGIPYVLFGLAVGRCTPLVACLVGIVEPLLNPLWVWLFNGEAPGPWAFLGGSVVILSVTSWCVWDAHHARNASR